MAIITPLYGHTREETAYLVSDYPYGRTVRCRIRYWIESDKKKGSRFCSQTEHPTTKVWNKPKKGTYHLITACMYLDEQGYVQCAGLSEYSSARECADFADNFPQMLNDNHSSLRVWAKKKAAYTRGCIEGQIVFIINKVVKPWSSVEIEEFRNELVLWDQIANK